MKKLGTEFLGTLFLVFTIASVVASPALGSMGAVAIGMALMVLVYMGGHISGAHYNPAVSTAILVSGNINLTEYLRYIIAQVLGAVAGLFLAMLVRPDALLAPIGVSLNSALIAETLWTFLLAFVVLNVAVAPANKGNSFYGFAIGGTVLVGALTLGVVSGGSFNPAVSIALGVGGILSWQAVATYIAVQIVAGALAGMKFKCNQNSCCEGKSCGS